MANNQDIMDFSVEEVCKSWDGKKVWTLIDDIWRQATVLSCGPNLNDKSWSFVVQSKHDANRFVISSKPSEDGKEFEFIEPADHIEIPAGSISNVLRSYDSLPSDSPTIDVASYQCPIHPYVAEYIRRLLYQLEIQTGDGHLKTLAAADAENTRLRLALEASNVAYAAQKEKYERHIADLESEIETLTEHNQALALAASGALHQEVETALTSLQTANRRLTKDNKALRDAVEVLKKSGPPPFEELRRLHSELATLRARAGNANTASQVSGDSASNTNSDAVKNELNQRLLSDVRGFGKRMSELSNRLLKFEAKVHELGKPAFDYHSSTDTTRMFNLITSEAGKLEEKLTKLEGILKINPRTGLSPFVPLQGSFAEQIAQLTQQLISMQARVDALTGTADRSSLSYSRVTELEKDKNDLLKLIAMAEEERDATHAYLDRTVQPILSENDQLRTELQAKNDQVRLLEAKTAPSKGLFW